MVNIVIKSTEIKDKRKKKINEIYSLKHEKKENHIFITVSKLI